MAILYAVKFGTTFCKFAPITGCKYFFYTIYLTITIPDPPVPPNPPAFPPPPPPPPPVFGRPLNPLDVSVPPVIIV